MLQTVRFVKTYFVRGSLPKGSTFMSGVTDPPTCGFARAVIIPGDKRSTILCPYTLQAYQVNNKCGEVSQAVDVEVTPERLAEVITKSWEDCVRQGVQRDFGVAAMVLNELGQPVPKFVPQADGKSGEEEKRGGKPINEAALRPCKPGSKRGEVAAFFMQAEPQSLHEAMARLGLSRSGVLSHLFTLNKDHGVGYELMNDYARLLVPEGFDLFAYVEPERAARPERKVDESGEPVAPRKRGGGKPINEAALKPIPDPGKRAEVAKLFLDWFDVSTAMAKLGLTRSAVLSHLFTINKDNGLGYELSEDSLQARLLVPEGHAVFAAKGGK